MPDAVHLNLDGAWDEGILGLPELSLHDWGPRLRYCAPRSVVGVFDRLIQSRLAPFILYGSGDFHYLTALWVGRLTQRGVLVSFDNHPDWDTRPPHWSCGGWISRALETGKVQRVCVWGCGNFELAIPGRLFANRAALRSGALEVHAWAERQSAGVQRRFACMTRQDWKEQFGRFVQALEGHDLYVTVDLDCLRAEEAMTNWENGLFSAADLAWAIGLLRQRARVIGGDVCGAYSRPVYARLTQRIAGSWDHPKLPPRDETEARRVNRVALEAIWPALVGAGPTSRRGPASPQS